LIAAFFCRFSLRGTRAGSDRSSLSLSDAIRFLLADSDLLLEFLVQGREARYSAGWLDDGEGVGVVNDLGGLGRGDKREDVVSRAAETIVIGVTIPDNLT
jgi:hypothetical protein